MEPTSHHNRGNSFQHASTSQAFASIAPLTEESSIVNIGDGGIVGQIPIAKTNKKNSSSPERSQAITIAAQAPTKQKFKLKKITKRANK